MAMRVLTPELPPSAASRPALGPVTRWQRHMPPVGSLDADVEYALQDYHKSEKPEERAKQQQRSLPPGRRLDLGRQELAIHVPNLHPVDGHHQARGEGPQEDQNEGLRNIDGDAAPA